MFPLSLDSGISPLWSIWLRCVSHHVLSFSLPLSLSFSLAFRLLVSVLHFFILSLSLPPSLCSSRMALGLAPGPNLVKGCRLGRHYLQCWVNSWDGSALWSSPPTSQQMGPCLASPRAKGAVAESQCPPRTPSPDASAAYLTLPQPGPLAAWPWAHSESERVGGWEGGRGRERERERAAITEISSPGTRSMLACPLNCTVRLLLRLKATVPCSTYLFFISNTVNYM